jgi:hypothetical protein
MTLGKIIKSDVKSMLYLREREKYKSNLHITFSVNHYYKLNENTCCAYGAEICVYDDSQNN